MLSPELILNHAGDFDRIWGNTNILDTNLPGTIIEVTHPAIGNTKNGDWVYFKNDHRYSKPGVHKGEPFAGENTIMVHREDSINFYWGWAARDYVLPYGDPKNPMLPAYSVWTQVLFDAYNKFPVPITQYISVIPGYTGDAQFFDVAAVGMEIFDDRTGSGGA